MELTIKTHDRKLSPTEEDLIRKKVNRLPRHLDQITDAEVIVTQERRRGGDLQVVQLTLRAHGTLLRAEESDRELAPALDAALESQVLTAGGVAIDAGALRHVADRAPHRVRLGGDVLTGDLCAPAVRLGQRRENFDGGRFPRTVRTE
jgi:ribosomal subunit interface protein